MQKDFGSLRGEGFGRCGADPMGVVGAGDQDDPVLEAVSIITIMSR